MKYIIITTLLSLCLFTSCSTTNYYVENDTGFEVDTETMAVIVSSSLLNKDCTYEDELVRIADMLENILSKEVVSEEYLRECAEVALAETSSNRRKNVMVAFDRLFKYYGNVAKKEGFTVDASIATIQSMSDGIFKVVEYHWVTCSE